MKKKFNYLMECQNYYLQNLQEKFGRPVGLTESQISEYEQSNNLKFPLAYREFLAWMGNDKSGIFQGSEWFLSDIDDNNEMLPELLEDNAISYDLKKDYICFFSHQGYMAAWFFTDEVVADPACYFFSESFDQNDYPIVSYKHFSYFLLQDIKSNANSII